MPTDTGSRGDQLPPLSKNSLRDELREEFALEKNLMYWTCVLALNVLAPDQHGTAATGVQVSANAPSFAGSASFQLAISSDAQVAAIGSITGGAGQTWEPNGNAFVPAIWNLFSASTIYTFYRSTDMAAIGSSSKSAGAMINGTGYSRGNSPPSSQLALGAGAGFSWFTGLANQNFVAFATAEQACSYAFW